MNLLNFLKEERSSRQVVNVEFYYRLSLDESGWVLATVKEVSLFDNYFSDLDTFQVYKLLITL